MTGQFAAMGGIAFLAGIVQGVTGFGSGTVQMMILPWFFPLNQAAGIAIIGGADGPTAIFLSSSTNQH